MEETFEASWNRPTVQLRTAHHNVSDIYNDDIKSAPPMVEGRYSATMTATGGLSMTATKMREVALSKLPPSAHDNRTGLHGFRAFALLGIWYFFSFTTLVLNKYFLSSQNGDPVVLAVSQLLACCLAGGVQLKCVRHSQPPPNKNTLSSAAVLGTLRFCTVLLGLVTLWYVPVSFAETVKSSAPVFTVLIAHLVLGDRTPWPVAFSLLPIMLGLALCSANELSFSQPGFIAAMATNLVECFQNVHSKHMLSDERCRLTPLELQATSSFFSVLLSIPLFLKYTPSAAQDDYYPPMVVLALAALSFHSQSLIEYALLTRISPVTHSVANTVKRALMIWLSIFVFGNPVTLLSGAGTLIVFFGVLLYNHARDVAFRSGNFSGRPVKLKEIVVTDHDV
ncbi:solute carrier family 35 member E2-like [Tropilaelaps mercedesae]|uniref:Solute carrier family 35 member E2-like n=1 Tax=Tropilaelaps mercedesae TaxID=418985 RepID=A0A1V9XCN7_9ACAR|nr:solute carrier family 35 member E2-like [Tropilaelaps mercedesae]